MKGLYWLILAAFAAATALIFYNSNSKNEGQKISGHFESECQNHEVILNWEDGTQKEKSLFTFKNSCTSDQSLQIQNIVNDIKDILKKGTAVDLKVQCAGTSGTNQFVKINSLIVGYRKICTLDSSSCREVLKETTNKRDADSVGEWISTQELFQSKICPASRVR